MGLFQLMAQIMGLCGFLIAVALGLFAAPWYILMAALLLGIVATHFLMPKQISGISSSIRELSDSASYPSHETGSMSPNRESTSNLLIYRGVVHSKK